MKEIQVGLEDRSYPIIIKQGLIDEVGTELRRNPFAKRYGIIADDRVAGLFGERLLASLKNNNIDAEMITFAAGEENKNLNTVAELSSKLAQLGFDRKDGLLALGGGVTGDITGFVAACYMRSVPFAQVPTTLLSQVDSSVGGKTGVDIPEGKNLVGAFYQPKAVFIDSGVLQGLPENEFRSGLAEVIKYGVIYDRDFFRFLEMNRKEILGLNLQILEEVIAWSCKIKAAIVEADEKEADLRRILNYGHTIGHAVEAASGYMLAHGSAVAMGIVAVSELAVLKGILDAREKERIEKLVNEFGLPTAIPQEYDRAEIKKYVLNDKKIVGGRVFFVLPNKIGKVIITDDVEPELIEKVLE
jgi:3-dehydroquinate synthase